MADSSLALIIPCALVLLALACGAALMARGGWAGTLRRDGRLGVRTPAASASDEAFALANKVGSPVFGGAAIVGVMVAGVLIGLRLPVVPTIVVALIGLIGVLGLLAAGGVLGERAARTVPLPARRPVAGPGCDGCACGAGGCAGLKRTGPATVAGAE